MFELMYFSLLVSGHSYFAIGIYLSVILTTPWLGFFSMLLVVLAIISAIALMSLCGE
jgi:ABC-type transport system involved in multi-copper enzyme maturation permease subunit